MKKKYICMLTLLLLFLLGSIVLVGCVSGSMDVQTFQTVMKEYTLNVTKAMF